MATRVNLLEKLGGLVITGMHKDTSCSAGSVSCEVEMCHCKCT